MNKREQLPPPSAPARAPTPLFALAFTLVSALAPAPELTSWAGGRRAGGRGFRRAAWRVMLGLGVVAALGGAAGAVRAEGAKPGVARVAGAELPALGFDFLAGYPFVIVDAGTGATPEEIADAMKKDQVPPAVRAFDGKRVLLTGYLLPLQIENGLSKKFILMKDVNTCCYGATPSINDYVIVTMQGAGIKVVQDVPTQLAGTLRIEQKYEGGYVVSLYTLEGDTFLGVNK